MQSETKYTKQDLETMRAWSLQRKIQVTQTRIIEWIGRYDWNVYISFSGGKDSTVLADLTARAYQAFWCPNRKEPLHLVFVNTGLEYPEIQKFVKYFAKWLERQYEIPVDLKVLTPELTFPEVLTKYGYPVIGKEVAKVIYYARHGSQWALNRLDGLDKCGKPSKFKERYKKYKFMVEAPFSTSQLCCDVMKKGPAKKYEKETGRKPIVATMTEESEQRQASWLRYGCNSFDKYKKVKKNKSAGRAPAGESIEQRPEEIDGREEFGHWEGDTVYSGKGKRKTTRALLTLTERKTRKEIIIAIPNRKAETVVKALDALERKLGARRFRAIFKSITFDNGTEFAAAEELERSCINKHLPRTKVYFCHPYSSWERGTNENTNGMIRRRFPKGTNFAAVTNAQIVQAENWINNYPRKILGYKSSEIVFRECLRELGIAA